MFVYDEHRPNLQMINQFINQSKFSANSEIDLKMRVALKNNLLIRNAKDCHLISFRCDSYQSFLHGKCTDCDNNERNCKLIGLWSHQLGTKFEKSIRPFQYYSIQNTDKTSCGEF